MAGKTMIVDGYNVIHCSRSIENALMAGLQSARDCLLRMCAGWLRNRNDVELFRVVFDGDSSVIGRDNLPPPGVRVEYTRSGETADERIVSILSRHETPRCCVVVTDDRELARGCRGLGVDIMSVIEFNRVYASTNLRRRTTNIVERDKSALTLEEMESINADLRKEWGLD
ncbi:MAG: NYN domain-containing protein [Lentisphaerae bacterium]|nr:NYN domain-containing protein [Lentisphaerota bacterium]